jgi:Raf kinase inhibitor-like YbhB/YbcL family protein
MIRRQEKTVLKRTNPEKGKATEMRQVISALVAFVVLLSACVSGAPTPLPHSGPAPDFALTSSAFREGAAIPKKYSCDGENISPPLKWSGATSDTKSYVLTMEDLDAPTGTVFPWLTHWIVFDIPASQTQIAEGAKGVGKSGMNGRGQTGYTGPCPPFGTTHRYNFILAAIDTQSLGLSDGVSRMDVETAIKGHQIVLTGLMGTYSR